MHLAERTKAIKPSATLTLSAKAKSLKAQGVDVIDLTSGEPDFDTPEFVKEAARQALRDGFTKYTPTSGIDELKAAIIEKLQKDNGLTYEKSQIIISCGAKHSLYNISQVLFEPGDEVIIPVPYWVTYPDQVRLSGATPVFVQSREEEGFQIQFEILKAYLTPRTKAIILNSPCNPTGSVYDQSTLDHVAGIMMERDLYVISDEIYEPFMYDGFRHVSIATISSDIKRRTLLVNGVSKAYAMTGWRIGYTAASKEIVDAMNTVQSQSTSNPTSIAQKAAVAALRGGQSFTQTMVAEFDRRRRYIVERLNKLPGISCPLPRGTFYAFPNVSALYSKYYRDKPLSSATDVADLFLEKAKVVVVPGEPFGAPGYLRLSYTTPMKELASALDRIEAALQVLQ
ncbi:MAG: pyridoxal phosphate-dependent aminotransferase [Nitrospiria bacterium]